MNSKRLLEGRSCLYCLAIGFRLALEFSYVDFVAPMYDYAGFILVDNSAKYTESWIIYVALLTLLPAKAHRPSDYLVGLAFFTFVAPLLVFFALADGERWVIYFVLIQYMLMDAARRMRLFRIPTIVNGTAIARNISVAGIIIATLWMISAAGVSNFSLDIYSVYDFREDANNAIYSGFMGYVVAWATSVCSSFLILLALRDKKYYVVIAIAILHVFWFGVSTHKSILFFPLQVIFICAFLKYTSALSLIPAGFSFVVLVSQISFYLTENIILGSLFVRRVFFVPSHLTFTYFDFFSTNTQVFWSNSFLSWVYRYPYNESVALIIGNYLNDPTLWANNSFFATGFMHAGMFGVILYGVTAGLILSVLDALARNGIPWWMSLAVVIVPFHSLFTSADLTTTLLTHGLGFALIMLPLLSDMKPRASASAHS